MSKTTMLVLSLRRFPFFARVKLVFGGTVNLLLHKTGDSVRVHGVDVR